MNAQQAIVVSLIVLSETSEHLSHLKMLGVECFFEGAKFLSGKGD